MSDGALGAAFPRPNAVPADPGVPGRVRTAAVALGSYLGLAFLLSASVWTAPTRRTLLAGDNDIGLFVWFLSNTSRALWHDQGQGLLVSQALNEPVGVNAMWNTSLLLPGALLSPVTELAGPILTLNLLIVLGPALSAWAAYLCSGRFLVGAGARLLAGLVFGFSPALMAAALGHFNLTLLALVPVLFLLVVDAATGRRTWRRSGLLIGLVAAAQLFVGEEVLALTAVALVVLLLVLATQRPRAIGERLPDLVKAGVLAALTCLALTGYGLWVQFLGPGRFSGPVQAPDAYVLDPLQLVVPNTVQLWNLGLHRTADLLGAEPYNASEVMGFLGVPLLLLTAFVVWRLRHEVVVRVTALTAAALLVLALGGELQLGGHRTGLPLPWDVAAHVPLLDTLLPVRWMLVVAMLLGLLVGLAVDRLPTQGWPRAVGVTALVLALLPLTPAPLRTVQPVVLPEFFARGADGLAGSVLVVPMSIPGFSVPMTWQAEAGMGFSMPGGYFLGPQPDGSAGAGPEVERPFSRFLFRLETTGQGRTVTPTSRAMARRDMSYWGTHAVVVGPTPFEQDCVAFFTELLGRAPERTGDVAVWTDVIPERL